MAGIKISQLTPGGAIQTVDEIPIARAGIETFKILANQIVTDGINIGTGPGQLFADKITPGSTALRFRTLSADQGLTITTSDTTINISTSGQNPIKTTFFGNASAISFPINGNFSRNTNNYRVDIDGVLQEPLADYTVVGSNIIFTTPPPLNSKVVVVANNLVTINETIPADNSVTTQKIALTAVTQDKIAPITATGTLSARTLQDRFADMINVKDFGAVGDGVTDDTAAIQAALSAAILIGKALYIPAGVYVCSNVISATTSNKACHIEGEGQHLSVLSWAAGATNGGGLSITYTSFPFPPYVGNLSLYNNDSGIGTALTIIGSDVTSSTFYGPIVEKLDIRGGDFFNHCWDTGINFVKCWYPKIEDININGLNEYGPTFVAAAGIKLTSCQVCYFSNFNIFHVTNGILEVAGAPGSIEHGEGFTFRDFEIVGVGTGISLRAEQTAPGTNIGSGHINAFNYGVRLKFQFQTSINNMLIYKTDDLSGPPQSFVGIELEDCRSNKVHDNLIHGFTAANLVGISMTGGVPALTDFNHVHNNLFYEFANSAGNKIGLLIGAGTGNCLFHHNISDSTVTTPILLSAGIEPTNKFNNNYPVNDQTFTDGDTTPSVANAISGFFLTANTGATTITAFDDGYNGQEITIFANDANTTIQHGASIILAGGTNFVMSAGDVLSLRAISSTTVFREISRTEV